MWKKIEPLIEIVPTSMHEKKEHQTLLGADEGQKVNLVVMVVEIKHFGGGRFRCLPPKHADQREKSKKSSSFLKLSNDELSFFFSFQINNASRRRLTRLGLIR